MDTTSKLPSYAEVLQEAIKNIDERKGLIIKRTSLLVLPSLFALIGFFLILLFSPAGSTTWIEYGIIGLCLFIALIAFPLTFIGQVIFDIEKRIWIDSFFDKKNLSASQSWHIAKKVFKQALKLKLAIFVRYILPATLGVIATTFLAYVFIVDMEDPSLAAIIFIGGLVGIPMATWLYNRVQLRYVWFIFLDRYKPDSFSVSEIFQEMRELNKIERDGSVKKILAAEFTSDLAADSMQTLTAFTMAHFQIVLGTKYGAPISAMTNAYVGGVTSQIADMATISATYLLYRYVRSAKYGDEQVVNESLYDLATMK